MAEIPTPDLAVPYAAPKHVKTMADVQPMAPKKGCCQVSVKLPAVIIFYAHSWPACQGKAPSRGWRFTHGIDGAIENVESATRQANSTQDEEPP